MTSEDDKIELLTIKGLLLMVVNPHLVKEMEIAFGEGSWRNNTQIQQFAIDVAKKNCTPTISELHEWLDRKIST